LALFGWATGGSWAGYYAALYSDHISALILDNTLYGGSSEHKLLGHGTDFEDPRHPGRFNAGACGAYRLNTAQSLLGAWDRGIPVSDKNVWRDPAVAKSYVDAAIASDPTSNSRTPPSFRSPFGALEDSFYQAIGRQLWDASLIRVPTLVISGEFDFWSRAADREALQQDLVHAPMVRVVVVPGATHFMHLDRAEHGRRRFLQEVQSFLDDSAGASGGRRR
jgi:pimeloyl-ACP methyl ester carboxylesterase